MTQCTNSSTLLISKHCPTCCVPLSGVTFLLTWDWIQPTKWDALTGSEIHLRDSGLMLTLLPSRLPDSNDLWVMKKWARSRNTQLFHNYSVSKCKQIFQKALSDIYMAERVLQCSFLPACTESKHAAVTVTEWQHSIKSLLWAAVLCFNISLIVAALLSAEAARAERGVAALRWHKVLSYFSRLSLCLLDPHHKKNPVF